MSKLLLNEKNGKISEVHFAYVKIQRPTKKYQSEDTEFSVDVIVDKATAKEMKKKFPKNGIREVDTSEFLAKYKFEPPFPEQDEQFVLKFKTNATNKDGEPKPYEWSSRPKVYVPGEEKIKDVTMDVRVANGSSGDIAFNISDTNYGVIHHLSAILVKNMIALENRTTTPFGEVEESDSKYEEYAEEFNPETEDVGF